MVDGRRVVAGDVLEQGVARRLVLHVAVFGGERRRDKQRADLSVRRPMRNNVQGTQLARRSVPPSTMSLLGLIRHMADVERNWLRRVMAQADAPPLYWSDDVEDADWAGAVADPAVVADAWRAWHEEVTLAEQSVAGSPDLAVRSPMQDGTTVALREVILHMVEEYARHLGHADLLRERIDGRVGQ